MKRKVNVWAIAAAAAVVVVVTALLLSTGCQNPVVGGPGLKMDGGFLEQGEAAIVTLTDEDLVIEGTVLKGYKGNYSYHVKLVLKVPARITVIADKAFYDCNNLTSVDFSGCTRLQTIGKEAFSSVLRRKYGFPLWLKV